MAPPPVFATLPRARIPWCSENLCVPFRHRTAGGPGKGMYTKLYRNAINVYGHWLWGIECVLSSFSDTGLIGLYSQAPHQYSKNLVSVTVCGMHARACVCPDLENISSFKFVAASSNLKLSGVEGTQIIKSLIFLGTLRPGRH